MNLVRREDKMPRMSAQEKKWQAESDAGALKRALEIQKDSVRFKAANKIIQEELKNLAIITNTKIVPKGGKKK